MTVREGFDIAATVGRRGTRDAVPVRSSNQGATLSEAGT